MFKIVRDGVPKPQFMMLCDGPCGNVILAVVEVENADRQQHHNAFYDSAAGQGWLVRLDRQLCPAHAREYAKTLPMVEIAGNGKLSLH